MARLCAFLMDSSLRCVPVNLGTLAGGGRSELYSINANSVAAGFSLNSSNQSRAVTWDSSNGMVDLGIATGYAHSWAYAINDAGTVVGFLGNNDNEEVYRRAMLWDSTSGMQDIGTLGTWAEARGINELGDVVGFSDTGSGQLHGFLYRDGALTDLNTLIDPASDWTITHAYDINDAGQIVGVGYNSVTNETHAILLSTNPVPEPATIAVWSILGLCGVGYGLRRRKRKTS